MTVVSSPAQGSLFTLRLPAERVGDRVSPPPDKVLPARAPATGLRILAAEDNPTNQAVLRALLEQVGMALTVVGDGLAAVETWQSDAFDLILMDVEMPRMDGRQATREIRAVEESRGLTPIPIIALTANAMPQQIEDYLEAGMNAAVTKPINLTQLFETLAKTLATPPAPRRTRRKA
ncbi:MAG: response regulator [Bryobacterales bacterium]|nr:response regulator [Bryobacterales bacterium]